MLDLKVEQRLKKIQLMRKLFLHKRHSILIQSIIEWYQLSAGVEDSILTKPNNLINYTNSIWFQDVTEFIYKHNISIFTKAFISTKGQRKDDKCMMQEIIKLHLPKTSLIQLNSCRIYLNISHLSDMLDPNGKQIEQNYMIGTK